MLLSEMYTSILCTYYLVFCTLHHMFPFSIHALRIVTMLSPKNTRSDNEITFYDPACILRRTVFIINRSAHNLNIAMLLLYVVFNAIYL
jgi:hypothetical protein